ncbi:MAG TPA: metallophosphatase [Candidatus Coprenecus stercoravium]|uniref:Metallophosphatase n=1 Tax=Candidatus Coprenecus stercoravium TaxID=2840735 RepID=A0A9D2GRN0_9BACT|nr:metallophosphatase [Candidatus Coprenecus stercoravium]
MAVRRLIVLIVIFRLAAFALKAQDLVILHTNDTHSQIEEIRTGGGAGTGGVHLRAEYFARIREQYGDDRVLVVDAGDYNQGTPYFTVFRGDLETELMNALGYEVTALGNHEFDNGVGDLARRLSKAEFQTVCANYDFSGTALEPYVKPYTIVYKNGRKIGIFGLLANIKSLVAGQNRDGILYINPYEAAQKQADYLKEVEKCDLVIALSHLGYSGWPNQPSDINLARKTRNIDIIIGGHTHTYLKSGKIYPDLDGKDVLIVQAGARGEYVGRLDINFK